MMALLGIVNIVVAALSLVVMLYVARRLGPEALGVGAIVLGIVTSIQAFLDIRFSDVTGRIIETAIEGDAIQRARRRAGILWLGVLGPAIPALGLALLSTIIGPAVASCFTAAPVAMRWFVFAGLQMAVTAPGAAALHLTRFSGAYGVIGRCRLLAAVLHASIMIIVLESFPGLDGFFLAGLLGSMARTSVLAAGFFHAWRRWRDVAFLAPDWRHAVAVFRAEKRLLWYGNILGYVKMLQRSGDVLVVAWLTGDHETGIYRFARQFVDQGLAVLQEAFNEVNHPFLLRAFQGRDWSAFRRRAANLALAGGVITIALVLGESLLLTRLLPPIVGAAFLPAIGPIILLTLSFVFLVGFHPALWAAFLGAGRLGRFTATAVAAITAQYSIFLLLHRCGLPGAQAAMVGHLAFHMTQTVLLLVILRRMTPALFSPAGETR